MKYFLVLITIFILGCSNFILPSPKEVVEKSILKYTDVSSVYLISKTDREYVYLASTGNGLIILFYVENFPPHRITKSIVLFRCVCGDLRERALNGL